MQIFDTAIIGGGPAGYSAALYCARAGLSTLVLEMMTPGGQMSATTNIDNYPGFDQGIDGFTLGDQMRKGAERFGAETRYAQVQQVFFHETPKRLVCSDTEVLAHTVVVATGANARELGLANEKAYQGKGVSYCATCDGMFFKGKTVAVAGGGNTAVEDALVLAKLCKKVYLIHRRDTLRAGRAEAAALAKMENVEFLWNRRIIDLHGDPKLSSVTLQDTQTGEPSVLEVEGVFVAIGRIPNTDLCKGQLHLDEQGYIKADETTRTNIAGVFAAGDVRTKPMRQVVTAAADGAVACKYVEEALHLA